MVTNDTIDPSSVQLVRPGSCTHHDRRVPNYLRAIGARLLSKPRKDTEMPVVDGFSLDHYCGTWYEIARLPVPFEHDICNVKTTIVHNTDGTISVLHRGRKCKISGKRKYVTGRATIPDARQPAKMEIHFPNMPLPAQYWVLDVSSDYRFALVGEPRKRYLWVLARSIEEPYGLVDSWLRHCLEYATNVLGYDVSKIVLTKHEKYEKLNTMATS